MKRFFILASAAIVALASCAKTEVVYKDAPQEIGFKAVTGVMTKAATLGDDNPTTMKVWAFNNQDHSTYFGDAGKVFAPNSGGDWVATPAAYWPLTGSLDFVYLAPEMEAAVNYNEGYKLSTKVKDNTVDVMYGTVVITESKQNKAMAAPLRHALAKVVVNVTSDLGGLVINSLVLEEVNICGDLTINYAGTNNNETACDDRLEWDNTDDDNITLLSSQTTVKDQKYSKECYVVPCDQKSLTLEYTLPDAASPLTYTHSLSGAKFVDGHLYTFNIKIGANEIKFNPDVAAWTEPSAVDVSVDPNTTSNNNPI